MKQHNAATSDGRNCWGSARERERMKARFNIRQRVHNQAAVQQPAVSSPQADDAFVVSEYLSYIRKGDRSKFSTTFLDQKFAVVSALHTIVFDEITKMDTIRVATNEFGPGYSDDLLKCLEGEKMTCFTLMEYAVWLGKYSIVSGMLHGGVNPCTRGGRFAEETDDRHQQQYRQLEEIGHRVLKRFFDSFPLRLSTYIVKRAVEMRALASHPSTAHYYYDDDDEPLFFECPICCQQISKGLRLRFAAGDDGNSCCRYGFCEPCFWKNVLVEIDSPRQRQASDVVSCLVCRQSRCSSSPQTSFLHRDLSHLGPSEKARLSLERFHQLPENQHELKATSTKKKKTTEQDHIASNWLDAVFASLGSTRDVRRDKFMVHVERNAVPYVRGSLLAGVDVNQTNEYGQTALYVAAWRKYHELVQLLLDHGADPFVKANGGSDVFAIASDNLLEVLHEHNGTHSASDVEDEKKTEASPLSPIQVLRNKLIPLFEASNTDDDSSKCITLIPASSKHPGAGSCIIDEAISSDTVDALLEMFRSLPVDSNQKQKKNAAPCSERSYYCDAEGYVRRLLGDVVVRAGVTGTTATVENDFDTKIVASDNDGAATTPKESSSVVRVYPHMRFLNYSRSGTVLAPHIDLCRVNPFCHPSEKQNPIHRSTHTFILYLTDCFTGGETGLLEEVTQDGSAPTLATVSPRRGRLLIFPHLTPHEGKEVVDLPKILLRGELQLRTAGPQL